MENIKQIVNSAKNEMMILQKKSLAITNKEDAVKLLMTFNPSEQLRFSQYPERCITGSAPSLIFVSNEYGEQVSEDWMMAELNDYQNFVGVKEENKASKEVLRSISIMLKNRYGYLKLTEIMLFFQKLKYGDYGEMYGCVDAVKILKSLKNFMKDRNNIIAMVEQDSRNKAEAERKEKQISYDEWIKLKSEK